MYLKASYISCLILAPEFGPKLNQSIANGHEQTSTCQHDFARHEDQQDDSGLHHPVDESREQFRFITERQSIHFDKNLNQKKSNKPAELAVGKDHTFEANRKFDIHTADNVLNPEVQKFHL